jgi:hypothetical protein
MISRLQIALPIGLVTAVLLTLLVVSRGVLGATPTADCSIDSMAREYGFTVEPQTAPASTDESAIANAELTVFPGARVAEQSRAIVRSKQIPSIDGHSALILRLDGMPDSPIGGPHDEAKQDARTLCAVAIYDRDSGDFLVRLRDLSE